MMPSEIQQALSEAFEMIVDTLDDTGLPPPLAAALLLKILVMVVQGHKPDKQFFLEQASAVWELEKFIKPHSSDIH